MLPTVHKYVLGAAMAAVLGLPGAAPASAASAPKIKAAYTVDADADGRVDGVSLKWSRKVRGGRDRRAPFAFKVAGYRVTEVGRARGTSQHLGVAEQPVCDTGGSIRVEYRKPRSRAARVRAARGRAVARSHRRDMRRFDAPIPRITCAVTLDADGDSRLDGVRITYSRAVRSRAQRRGRFLFSVAGYRVRKVGAARGRFLQVQLAEHGEPDSGATPLVAYDRPKRKRDRPFAVRSGRRGQAFAATYQDTRDGVAPRLVSGATGDSDRDGLLDELTVRFSEPVHTAGTAGIAVLGMKVRSVTPHDATATLSLVEGTARGDARPGAWVGGPGVADLAGNTALRSAVTPTDRAAPVMRGAITQDTGGAPGRIDAVSVTFSEPVAHTRDAGGAYSFLLAERRVTSVEAATGLAVQVRIAEATGPDSGERPSVRYIPGAGFPVIDLAGNEVSEGHTNPVDRVAPVLLSAFTSDADSNGRIDHTTLRFSEDVRHDPEAGQASFSVAGHQVAGAGAAARAEIVTSLEEAGSPDSGARPAVTYTRDGVEDVQDATGNTTPTSSLAQASDGAPPVLLDARTADVDDDGRLDRIDTTWSEPLDHPDDAAAPFAIAASAPSVARVRAAEGTNLAIDLVEPTGPDTGSTPILTYPAGDQPVRDAAGLQPAPKGWPRTSRDALPPRLVSARTGDGDADGSIDSVALQFSETVLHERETAPAGSFTAGPFTVLSAEAATGDGFDLTLEESGTADSGLRPPVGYTPDGQEDVRDASGELRARREPRAGGRRRPARAARRRDR